MYHNSITLVADQRSDCGVSTGHYYRSKKLYSDCLDLNLRPNFFAFCDYKALFEFIVNFIDSATSYDLLVLDIYLLDQIFDSEFLASIPCKLLTYDYTRTNSLVSRSHFDINLTSVSPAARIINNIHCLPLPTALETDLPPKLRQLTHSHKKIFFMTLGGSYISSLFDTLLSFFAEYSNSYTNALFIVHDPRLELLESHQFHYQSDNLIIIPSSSYLPYLLHRADYLFTAGGLSFLYSINSPFNRKTFVFPVYNHQISNVLPYLSDRISLVLWTKLSTFFFESIRDIINSSDSSLPTFDEVSTNPSFNLLTYLEIL